MSQNHNSNTNKAEPCHWCFGTGVNADGNPKNPQPETKCAACHGTGFTPPADTPAIPTPDLVGVDRKKDTNSPAAEKPVCSDCGQPTFIDCHMYCHSTRTAKPEPTAESAEQQFYDRVRNGYYYSAEALIPDVQAIIDSAKAEAAIKELVELSWQGPDESPDWFEKYITERLTALKGDTK